MVIIVGDLPSSPCRERLAAIERAADSLFHAQGIRFADPPVATAEPELPCGYFVIAVDATSRAPLGFAHVVTDDGFAHLEQLSVDPAHSRLGHGRSLVAAAVTEARSRGYSEVTLRTYDEIPWNRPFYESCGFRRIEAPTAPFFERILAAEEDLGLSLHGRRVFMRIRTSASDASAPPQNSSPTADRTTAGDGRSSAR